MWLLARGQRILLARARAVIAQALPRTAQAWAEVVNGAVGSLVPGTRREPLTKHGNGCPRRRSRPRPTPGRFAAAPNHGTRAGEQDPLSSSQKPHDGTRERQPAQSESLSRVPSCGFWLEDSRILLGPRHGRDCSGACREAPGVGLAVNGAVGSRWHASRSRSRTSAHAWAVRGSACGTRAGEGFLS